MARIPTASLDLRPTDIEANLDLLIGTVQNLALLVAGNVHDEDVQASPAPSVQEPQAKPCVHILDT